MKKKKESVVKVDRIDPKGNMHVQTKVHTNPGPKWLADRQLISGYSQTGF